jgi:putative two-component system response regulator
MGELQNSILNTLAELIEFRTRELKGHTTRIQKYLTLFMAALVSEKTYAGEIENWNLASLIPSSQLHDVGKIKVNEAILNKPGKLSTEEFDLIKNHTAWGVKIIEDLEQKTGPHIFVNHAKIFAASHHEKWDGSGYPQGLKGEAIPLQGRLLAIADVYDALISKLPYKEPLAPSEAAKIILSEKGAHFDPALVDIFATLSDNFAAIAATVY